MWANLLLSVLLAALCLKVNAYPGFRKKIPNGYNVPNPCNLSITWPGVGHENVQGSGVRNPFGLAFAENNFVWDQTLCQKDSDEDGLTNGQELGDPNCTWTAGSNSTLSPSLSHPGVCEPLDSPVCLVKNHWLKNCGPKRLDCPAIHEPGVLNYTLRFPVSPVPARETTYICHKFKLPSDSETDIIAVEVVLENARVTHHMQLFAFAEEPTGNPTGDSFECGMTTKTNCMPLIGLGAGDIAGQCLNSQVGYRMGSDGFQWAVLQIHWNNPELEPNLTDASGMRIYYTHNLRPNRGQVAIVAQMYLAIPPGQPEVTQTAKCSSVCTQKLGKPFFITSAFLHMHSLGKSGVISIWRGGKQVRVLENVTHYDYNTPTIALLENPVEVKPGDEIVASCVYDATHRTSTTYFGEATSDEMCMAFLSYYPAFEGLGYCAEYRVIPICPKTLAIEPVEPCDLAYFATFRI